MPSPRVPIWLSCFSCVNTAKYVDDTDTQHAYGNCHHGFLVSSKPSATSKRCTTVSISSLAGETVSPCSNELLNTRIHGETGLTAIDRGLVATAPGTALNGLRVNASGIQQLRRLSVAVQGSERGASLQLQRLCDHLRSKLSVPLIWVDVWGDRRPCACTLAVSGSAEEQVPLGLARHLSPGEQHMADPAAPLDSTADALELRVLLPQLLPPPPQPPSTSPMQGSTGFGTAHRPASGGGGGVSSTLGSSGRTTPASRGAIRVPPGVTGPRHTTRSRTSPGSSGSRFVSPLYFHSERATTPSQLPQPQPQQGLSAPGQWTAPVYADRWSTPTCVGRGNSRATSQLRAPAVHAFSDRDSGGSTDRNSYYAASLLASHPGTVPATVGSGGGEAAAAAAGTATATATSGMIRALAIYRADLATAAAAAAAASAAPAATVDEPPGAAVLPLHVMHLMQQYDNGLRAVWALPLMPAHDKCTAQVGGVVASPRKPRSHPFESAQGGQGPPTTDGGSGVRMSAPGTTWAPRSVGNGISTSVRTTTTTTKAGGPSVSVGRGCSAGLDESSCRPGGAAPRPVGMVYLVGRDESLFNGSRETLDLFRRWLSETIVEGQLQVVADLAGLLAGEAGEAEPGAGTGAEETAVAARDPAAVEAAGAAKADADTMGVPEAEAEAEAEAGEGVAADAMIRGGDTAPPGGPEAADGAVVGLKAVAANATAAATTAARGSALEVLEAIAAHLSDFFTHRTQGISEVLAYPAFLTPSAASPADPGAGRVVLLLPRVATRARRMQQLEQQQPRVARAYPPQPPSDRPSEHPNPHVRQQQQQKLLQQQSQSQLEQRSALTPGAKSRAALRLGTADTISLAPVPELTDAASTPAAAGAATVFQVDAWTQFVSSDPAALTTYLAPPGARACPFRPPGAGRAVSPADIAGGVPPRRFGLGPYSAPVPASEDPLESDWPGEAPRTTSGISLTDSDSLVSEIGESAVASEASSHGWAVDQPQQREQQQQQQQQPQQQQKQESGAQQQQQQHHHHHHHQEERDAERGLKLALLPFAVPTRNTLLHAVVAEECERRARPTAAAVAAATATAATASVTATETATAAAAPTRSPLHGSSGATMGINTAEQRGLLPMLLNHMSGNSPHAGRGGEGRGSGTGAGATGGGVRRSSSGWSSTSYQPSSGSHPQQPSLPPGTRNTDFADLRLLPGRPRDVLVRVVPRAVSRTPPPRDRLLRMPTAPAASGQGESTGESSSSVKAAPMQQAAPIMAIYLSFSESLKSELMGELQYTLDALMVLLSGVFNAALSSETMKPQLERLLGEARVINPTSFPFSQ